MIGIQNRNVCTLEKPVPGCLGKMVNLFDRTAGVARNRLLADKPHRDDCSLSRNQSDVARIPSPIGDQIDNMLMVSELWRNSSNGKLNGTPMKMLIAREMSKEAESKWNSPNLVAKLMGLEALPRGQPDSAAQGFHSKFNSRVTQTQSALPLGCSQGEHELFDKQRHSEIYHCQEQSEFKDVYEIWRQSEKTNVVKDSSPQRGTRIENTNEKRMALIRQKFIEAKRLSTDEKLRQSKEFQDALELLNSNSDLLIKFLQEPNSLFPQHLYEMRSSPLPQTRQITLLRPCKIVDNDKVAGSGENMEKQTKKPVLAGQENGRDKSNYRFPPASSGWKADDNPSQMTRIVVLKPSPGKTHDIKAIASPPSSSPRTVNGGDFCGKPKYDELQKSKELAEEIADHMQENLSGHRRDETLLSSVFSNGYIGDVSSFNKSENEFEVGNLSDSEFMSPSSRHSWDHINRFDSPCCSSSFSRASFSPESSVCREAKKRLSERWALMASNGICQEQRHTRRSSSTLGEMLALPDMKSSARSDEGSSKERDLEESSAHLSINVDKCEGVDNSPRNFLRSKSVPVSSTKYGDRLNVEVSDADASKMHGSKELSKAKSGKSSFKERVLSLFFSTNKKLSKEKLCKSPSIDISNSATAGTPGFLVHPMKYSSNMTPCVNENGVEESLSPRTQESVSKTSSRDLIGMELREGIVSRESVLHAAKSARTLGNPSENQEQPSPISVLMPSFEEDDSTTPESSCSFKTDQLGMQMPVHPAKSNLIDKSPPIEPMQKALSWDDYSAQLATPYISKQHLASPRTKEERDWFLLVLNLLSAAGLDSEVRPISVVGHWHSPESLLGPMLREKYVSLSNTGLMHEAKKRQWRSNRMLVFDCVNTAVANIIGYYESNTTSVRIGLCNGGRDGPLQGPSHKLADRVWEQIKEWGTVEVAEDGGDRDSLVVDRVVRKEVVGVGWVDGRRSEVDTAVGQEIGGKLLEELLEEAVIELTCSV